MKTLIYATAAIALIGAPAVHAGDRTLGAAGGAAAGAATGAVVGGPVGAAVGGVAGAIIGSATAVPVRARTYVVEHPVDSVEIQGRLSRGYAIPEDVEIHQIPDEPGYGYVYIENRPVIVREANREVVYAGPIEERSGETTGSVEVRRQPPDTVITYVEHHHREPVMIQGSVDIGADVPDTVDLAPIPDDPDYAYVYTQNGPVIVSRRTRTVVWSR